MNKEMNLNELLTEKSENVMSMTIGEFISTCIKQKRQQLQSEVANSENPNDIEIVSAQSTISLASVFIEGLEEILADVDALQLFYDDDCDRRLQKVKQTRWDIYNAIEHLSQLIDYENETIALCSDDSQS